MLSHIVVALCLAAAPADSSKTVVPSDSLSTADTAATVLQPAPSRDSLPAYTMKETVVTATRTPLAVSVAPASVTVLAAGTMSSGEDVISSMARTQGACLGRNGGTGSVASLYIRGAKSENVLYLLDGVPLNSAQTGVFDLNQMPANPQRIEIVRGPSSSLYGANAVAAVVNIITDETDREKPFSRVTFEKGKNGGQLLEALVARRLWSRTLLSINGSWNKNGGERVNSDYDGTNYAASFSAVPFGRFRVKMRYGLHKSENGSPGSTVEGVTPNDRLRNRSQEASVTASYGDRGRLIVASNDVQTDFVQPATTTRTETKQTTADGQYSFTPFARGTTVAGASLRTVRSIGDGSGSHRLKNTGVFLNQQYQALEKLLVVAGLRADWNQPYRAQLSPSLSASYILSPLATVYGSFGLAFRSPTVNELYWDKPSWGMYGNAGLRPEKSRQFELGSKLQWRALSAGLSLFQRTTRDMIDWQSFPDWSYRTVNLGAVDVSGLEVSSDWRVLSWLALGGQYSYCKAVNDTAGRPVLLYRPLHTAGFHAAVEELVIAQPLRLSWRIDVQYASRQGTQAPGLELPARAVTDQTFSVHIADARVYYTVTNLFNADYQTRLGYPMPRRAYAFGIVMELWN